MDVINIKTDSKNPPLYFIVTNIHTFDYESLLLTYIIHKEVFYPEFSRNF